MARGSIVLVTGRMGSGKSHYVVSQMPGLKGIIYTNIPTTDKLPREVVKVSTEQVDDWIINGQEIKGPGYLLLDEAHFLFPPRMEGDRRRLVREWLSLTRKRGITVWLITQLADQIAPGVRELADYERMSYTRANEKEPLTGIAVDDINQIKAALTGVYTPVTWIDEYSAVGKSKILMGTKIHYLRPSIYEWYDSYNVDKDTLNACKGDSPKLDQDGNLLPGALEDQGDDDLGVRALEEWEQVNPLHLLLRVFLRNVFGMATGQVARAMYVLLAVMCAPYIFPSIMWVFDSAIVRTEAGKLAEAKLNGETIEGLENESGNEVSTVFPPTAAGVRAAVVAPRRNRVGSLLLVSGQLYDAAAIYGALRGKHDFGRSALVQFTKPGGP